MCDLKRKATKAFLEQRLHQFIKRQIVNRTIASLPRGELPEKMTQRVKNKMEITAKHLQVSSQLAKMCCLMLTIRKKNRMTVV